MYYANGPVVEGGRALMMRAAAAARGNANGPDRPAVRFSLSGDISTDNETRFLSHGFVLGLPVTLKSELVCLCTLGRNIGGA